MATLPLLPDLSAAIPLSGLDGATHEALMQMLQQGIDDSIRAFHEGAGPEVLTRYRSDLVSRLIEHIWVRMCGHDSALALCAVGGFGRGYLFPYSDVDLLVLGNSLNAIKDASRQLEAFFTSLWDMGLELGQAVRTLDENRTLASHDATIYTNLLDIRYLSGNKHAWHGVQRLLEDPEIWPPKAYLHAKLAEQDERNARFEDTAHHLEPNIKEGLGGLRQIDTLRWLGQRILHGKQMDVLVERGIIDQAENSQLAAAEATLRRYRFALHAKAGRAEERLLFDYQQDLAAELGFEDKHSKNLGVEQFMQAYYRAAAAIDRLGSQVGERFEQMLDDTHTPVSINADFSMLGTRLDVDDDMLFIRRPEALIEAFDVRLEHDEITGFSAKTMRGLHEAAAYHGADLATHRGVMRAFRQLFGKGNLVADVLWQMHRYGLLAVLIPPFGKIVGRMQYDLFHAYTVDEHSLKVVRNVAFFASADAQRGLPLGYALYADIAHPDLLILAALFHDIAKGRGGDHSVLGEIDAREFCQNLGIDATSIDLVAWLVRWHLLMSNTAQRKDITDPKVIAEFAVEVGDWERLDYLYLLTVADIRGTSPKLWNSWKDRLLSDLYVAARFALRSDVALPLRTETRVKASREHALALLADDGFDGEDIAKLWASFPDESFLRHRPEQIAWQTRAILRAEGHVPLVEVHPFSVRGATELFVYADDRDGIFATITAILDRQRFAVVEARILNSHDGKALDTFLLLETRTQKPANLERVEVLRQRLLEGLGISADVVPVKRDMPRQLRHFQMQPQVSFTLDPAKHLTQVALVCTDAPGILANAAQAFFAANIRVHDARIATFGERVEDFFLVSDAYNQPLEEPVCQALSTSLQKVLHQPFMPET